MASLAEREEEQADSVSRFHDPFTQSRVSLSLSLYGSLAIRLRLATLLKTEKE